MHFNRDEIGLRPARGKTPLSADQVNGIALHHHGGSKLGNVERCKSALRAFQAQHMAPGGLGTETGASDIAYQEAIDQAGNVYHLRGLRWRSGANGAADVNEEYGAILLLLGNGETPSEAMIAATRRRIARHRDIFPGSRLIVPHSAIRPGATDCPGDKIRALIEDDAFERAAFQPAKESE